MKERVLRLYSGAIVLGILVGLVSSLFQLGIDQMEDAMLYVLKIANYWGVGQILCYGVLSMVMVFLAWLSVTQIAPEAQGSGVQEIEGALLHERPVFWKRLIPVKFFGGILALSAKMVGGREGPTIQMGGNLGAMLGQLFKMPQARIDTLVAAGAAAGLAAAFNAPLAGVLFVMEEMRNQFNYSFTDFKMVIIGCVTATITMHLIVGSGPAIVMNVFSLPGASSLWLFFCFGILVGFMGLVFNKVLMASLNRVDRLSLKMRIFYVLSIGLLVGILASTYPDTVGGGYKIISQSFSSTPSLFVLCSLLMVRFVTTMLCYSSGVPGGIFAPMLALGTLLGLSFSECMQWVLTDTTVHPGMFAVAGMGGLFAATVRSPITGVILIVEMTQNYSLILPLMITCITSTTIMQLAGNPPIYAQLLKRTLKKQG